MVRLLPILCLLAACGKPDDGTGRPLTGTVGGGTPVGLGTGTTTGPLTTRTLPDNVLLVIVDDWGIDKARSYVPNLPNLPRQPVLDQLADEGVRFKNAYAAPTCTPARAMLLTGRYTHQSGQGRNVGHPQAPAELSVGETFLPTALDAGEVDWASGFFGKWHLADFDSPSNVDHPLLAGFDHFSGTLSNLNGSSYYEHDWIVDGQVETNTTYATTRTVDDALGWIGSVPEPWFATVSFHAPHTPMDPPPEALLAEPLPVDAGDVVVHGALIEAADTELGRLLDGVDLDHTTVIVLGDNGTWADAVILPFNPNRAKGTLFEAGVLVPLIVRGPAVQAPGQASDALVHLVDLFPTVLELSGVDATGLGGHRPGQSLAPLLADPTASAGHPALFTSLFSDLPGPPWTNWHWTIRNQTHKLLGVEGTGLDYVQVYDLQAATYSEGFALDDTDPAVVAIRDALLAERDALLAATPYEPL